MTHKNYLLMFVLTVLVFAGQVSAQRWSLKHIPGDGRTEGVVLGQGTEIVVEVSQTDITQSVNAIQFVFDFDQSLLALKVVVVKKDEDDEGIETNPPSAGIITGGNTVTLFFISSVPVDVPASIRFTFTTKEDVTGREFSIGIRRFALDAVTYTPSAMVSFNTVRPPLHLDTQIESPAQNDNVLEMAEKQAGDTIQFQLYVPDAAGQQFNAFELELALQGKTASDYISSASRGWVSSVSGTNLVLRSSISGSVSNTGYVGQVDLEVTDALTKKDTLRVTGASLATMVRETQLDVSNAELSFAYLCPGDFDRNGKIEIPDFLLFVKVFGASTGDAKFDALMDMDSKGEVDIPDFLLFVKVFGKTCDTTSPPPPPPPPPPLPLTVHIPDANLRAVIEASLGKASGAPITQAEMATLTSLESFAGIINNKVIRDLTGLEFATGLTDLNLSGNSISDVSALSNLTNLTYLRLVGNSISDVSALSNLTNLTLLWLEGNSISDVSALSNLANLTELVLSGNSISDVSALSNLTNLTLLWHNQNSISDVSALSNLTNLTSLFLFQNSISDVSALSNLTNLTELVLYQNSISDVSALSNLTNLTLLRLEDNNISDVSALSNLTNLTSLGLEGNSISDVSALSNLTNLTRLYLQDNSISDVSALSGMTDLRWLELYNNNILDLSPLVANTGLGNGDEVDVRGNPLSATSINTHIPALQGRGVNVRFDAPQSDTIPDANLRAAIETSLGKASGAPITQAEMASLTRLEAPNKNIRDLTGLEFATGLTFLHLGPVSRSALVNSNEISDLSPLSGLISLTDLDLSNTNISDVSALSGLTNLTDLNLFNNNITDVSALSGLTSLTDLELGSNNNISDVSALSGLTNLTELGLSNNNITDVSALSGLTNLTELNLNGNRRITDVSALSKLINLTTYLGLYNNNISDIAPLVAITGLGSGSRVDVRGNPLNATSINTHIPTLQGRGVDVRFDAPPSISSISSIINRTQNASPDLHPAYSPNGRKIVFVSTRDHSNSAYANREIYVMDANGSNPVRLTSNSIEDNRPDWSSDGSKIVFSSTRDNRGGEIYVMDANGSNPVRLTHNSVQVYAPVWSPDGSKIAFTSNTRSGGGGEIYVMNADGSNPRNLTQNGNDYHDVYPAWSPDGTKIAFCSRPDQVRDRTNGIYVMNTDGSNLVRLTSTGQVYALTYSPDGSKIAFVTSSNIYVMNADGSNRVQLTESNDINSLSVIDWSPDGGKLVFVSGRDGDDDIYEGTLVTSP